ncbi:MAG TPA: Wadjet anti-phage system protein JetD domain-containing protein [Acidimicrobiales bacterium]|nr:Wadjet anti-phage system protein JetD domain-containing protein [Acidimicrobiales bacterium]
MTPTQAAAHARTWTDVRQLRGSLRRRWESGRYLRDYCASVPWVPVTLPVKGPAAAEFLDRFEEARRWVADFERDSRAAGGVERFSIEYRTVRGRNLGANAVPARIRIERFDQLCALLGTSGEVRDLDLLLDDTRAQVPALVPWVTGHPLVALGHREVWGELLSTVAWIAAHDTASLYLRQIDVDGVDTKFVEGHRKLLDDLLTTVLPAARIDPQYSYADFSRRFKFRLKPGYTRFRLLDRSTTGFPAGVSELTMRTDELAGMEPDVTTVFVVENEISYLAFPQVADSAVVFGAGFGLTRLSDLPWLHHKQIAYWGDIDTHGFDILDRLRTRFGAVQSMLMDHDTLLAHHDQWVDEPSPTNRRLPHLTEAEGALYSDLIEGRYGPRVRLEQERVRFSLLRQALRPWTT